MTSKKTKAELLEENSELKRKASNLNIKLGFEEEDDNEEYYSLSTKSTKVELQEENAELRRTIRTLKTGVYLDEQEEKLKKRESKKALWQGVHLVISLTIIILNPDYALWLILLAIITGVLVHEKDWG